MLLARTIKLSVLLICLFLPYSVLAANLFPSDNLLLYSTESNSYKLSSPNIAWRLLRPIEGNKIGDTVYLNNYYYQIIELDGTRTLHRLKYAIYRETVSEIDSSSDMRIIPYANGIIVQSNQQYYDISNDHIVSKINLPFSGDLLLLDNKYFFSNNGNIQIVSNTLEHSAPCLNAQVIKSAQLIISCQSKSKYLYVNNELLDLETYTTSTVYNDKIIILNLINGNTQIIDSTIKHEIKLSSAVSFILAGSRVFFTDPAGLWELNYSEAQLYKLSNLSQAQVFNLNNEAVIIKTNSEDFYSSKSGEYKSFNSLASYSAVVPAKNGALLFTKDGSIVQSFNYETQEVRIMNASWAKSSKIKEVVSYRDTNYLMLLNSSQNQNLYKTENLESWTRITLPTKITESLSLAETRQLQAGQLVEVIGVLTTNSGDITEEINYLQDNSGALQIYSSKPISNAGNTALIYGTMSSSGAKRILVNDLILLGESKINPISRSIQQAFSRLGEISSISEEVVNINDDSLVLKYADTKLNFKHILTKLSAGTTIKANVIADYNSLTKKIELWAIGAISKVENKSEPSQVETNTQSTKTTENPKKELGKNETVTRNITVTTISKTTYVPEALNDEVLIASSKEDLSAHNYFYALFGFLIGLMSLFSRRMATKQLIR